MHADANSSPSRRKTAPTVNLPPVVTPMFYDLHQKKNLDYDELHGRYIRPCNLANIASNYALAMIGIAQLGYYKGKSGTVRNYQCACCELRIRFKRKSNGPDDLYVLDTVNLLHYLLNTSCGKSPHREHCNTPESKRITKLMMI